MKNKIITIVLVSIIVIETSLMTYFIVTKDNSNEIQKDHNNSNEIQEEKEPIEWFNFEPLVEFFGENILLTPLTFTSPENLFNDEFDESTLIYDFLSIKNFEESRKINLGPLAQQEYGYKFTLNEIQSHIKEKFNYEYSISELENVFGFYYNEEHKCYISPPWTAAPVQVPPSIKEIYYKDGYYHIKFYHALDKENPGEMVITKENENYYLYSSTGIKY